MIRHTGFNPEMEKAEPVPRRKFSDATREKMRLSHWGKPSPRKGKKLGPQTPEQRKKSGDAVRNSVKFQTAMKSREFREKMTEVLRRIPRAKGEKHWNWQGGKWSDEEYVKNCIQYNNRRQKLRRKGVEGSHTRAEWEDLKKKYNYMCLCCKQQEPFIKLSVDHIMPILLGGTNFISNIQPLCLPCNMRKHATYIDYTKQYEQA